jgi:hypothetical protein
MDLEMRAANLASTEGGCPLWNPIWIAAIAFLIVLSCNVSPTSDPISRSDLIGEYEGKWHGGQSDKLTLNADSTYVREFTSFDGQHYVDRGKWELLYLRSDSDLTCVDLTLLGFIDRFESDSLRPNEHLSGAAGVPDTLPAYRTIGVFKYTPGSVTYVLLGGKDDPVWERQFGR